MKHVFIAALFLPMLVGLVQSCAEEKEPVTAIPCVDFKGNSYKTVIIGDQVWMAENLATKYFTDGSEIYNYEVAKNWPNKNAPQYSYFFESGVYSTFGLLYNKSAVTLNLLAPKGWRIPTQEDWEKLIAYTKTLSTNDSVVWVAKALSSTAKWQRSQGIGTIGNQLSANNATGFNAQPFGYLTEYDGFEGEDKICMFWSTTRDTSTHCLKVMALKYNGTDVDWENLNDEIKACYVRCVKDL